MKKRIAILGSTGSIGTQALDVIKKHPEHFEVELLTAHRNAGLLIRQAREFMPNAVVIADDCKYQEVRQQLSDLPIKVWSGNESLAQAVQMDTVDMVLTAMVGYAGLRPTIKAIEAGKHIALANKETLVVAGELIMNLAKQKGTPIYPVDSEHSAIFQCLAGEAHNPVEKIYLTASGGPFREKSKEYLENVSRTEALQHPNWCMGDKITIDSASLMNKGLEAIEARWLFDLQPDQIDVIVHPQSVIHSIVQFEDGSMKAQMGLPDMRLPILYALNYPQRLKTDLPRFDFTKYPQLTFESPDTERFPNLAIAFEALRRGGNTPCAMNAANEVCVAAFLSDKTRFAEMPRIIEQTISRVTFISHPDYSQLLETDCEARKVAASLVGLSDP